MRLFLAALPEDAVVQRVAAVQQAFRRAHVHGNYTPPENLHLTLAFIGDYHDPDAVLEAMARVSFAPFTVTLDHIGCFGDLWWAGVQESLALNALSQRLRRALADAGIPFDKKSFRPHMTFLRNASGLREHLQPEPQLPPTRMPVEGVSLMLSTRGKNGMLYTELGYASADRDL